MLSIYQLGMHRKYLKVTFFRNTIQVQTFFMCECVTKNKCDVSRMIWFFLIKYHFVQLKHTRGILFDVSRVFYGHVDVFFLNIYGQTLIRLINNDFWRDVIHKFLCSWSWEIKVTQLKPEHVFREYARYLRLFEKTYSYKTQKISLM